MTLNLKKKCHLICIRSFSSVWERKISALLYFTGFFSLQKHTCRLMTKHKTHKIWCPQCVSFYCRPNKSHKTQIKWWSSQRISSNILLTYHFPIYHNYSTTCFNMLLHKSFLLFFMYIGKKLGHFDSNEGLGRVAKQLCCHVISCQNFWGSCINCDNRFILQKKKTKVKEKIILISVSYSPDRSN